MHNLQLEPVSCAMIACRFGMTPMRSAAGRALLVLSAASLRSFRNSDGEYFTEEDAARKDWRIRAAPVMMGEAPEVPPKPVM